MLGPVSSFRLETGEKEENNKIKLSGGKSMYVI